MADTQNYRVKGHSAPLDAYFDPPPEPMIKIASTPTSTIPHPSQFIHMPTSSTSAFINYQSSIINNNNSKSSKIIVAAQPSNAGSSLLQTPSSFAAPFPSNLPGVIYTGDQPARKDLGTTFREDSQQHHHNKGQHHINWFYPLLAVLGVLALLTLTIYFYVEKKRRRASIAPHRHIKWSPDDNHHPNNNSGDGIPRYPSWSSYSATTVVDKSSKIMMAPPPAYTTTTKEEKRLTSDTLVEPASVAMLKTQYSPQLAFSPSLVAGEFPQHQQQHESFPTELAQQQQQMNNDNNNNNNNNNNKLGISPSNTLIDNAGVISDKNQQQQQRPRIEIYEPQINLFDEVEEDHIVVSLPTEKN